MPSKLYDSFKAATIAYLAALRPHRWRLHATSIFFLACLFWGGFHSPLLAQTALVKDINPGTNSSVSGNFAVMGSTIYFAADDGTNGVELWKTDGTADGSHSKVARRRVQLIAPGLPAGRGGDGPRSQRL